MRWHLRRGNLFSENRCARIMIGETGHHPFYMTKLCARSKHRETSPGITPAKVFNRDATRPPRVHAGARRFIKVDRVRPGKCPTIVIHLEKFAGFKNAEEGSCGPARPVGRRAVDRSGTQLRSKGGASAVLHMVGFRVRVGGGAHALKPRARARLFVCRKGPRGTSPERKGCGSDEEHRNVATHPRTVSMTSAMTRTKANLAAEKSNRFGPVRSKKERAQRCETLGAQFAYAFRRPVALNQKTPALFAIHPQPFPLRR